MNLIAQLTRHKIDPFGFCWCCCVFIPNRHSWWLWCQISQVIAQIRFKVSKQHCAPWNLEVFCRASLLVFSQTFTIFQIPVLQNFSSVTSLPDPAQVCMHSLCHAVRAMHEVCSIINGSRTLGGLTHPFLPDDSRKNAAPWTSGGRQRLNHLRLCPFSAQYNMLFAAGGCVWTSASLIGWGKAGTQRSRIQEGTCSLINKAPGSFGLKGRMVIAVRIGATALLCLHRLFIGEVSAHPCESSHDSHRRGNTHGVGPPKVSLFSRLLWSPWCK